MDMADFYGLNQEQLMEVYEIILSKSGRPFSYIQNKIPSYKGKDERWHPLTGVDPYELAQKCEIDLSVIPLPLTDLGGLSKLADQRLFKKCVEEVMIPERTAKLSHSQLARDIVSQLERAGFQSDHKIPLPDKLMEGLSRHGADPYLLMKSVSNTTRWSFPQHYLKRDTLKERPTSFEIKNGSHVLTEAAKARLTDYAATLVDNNPVTPIYFIKNFHRLCAKQGLAVSPYVDDTQPETLATDTRQTLERAFQCMKSSDPNGFDAAIMSLTYRFQPRAVSRERGQHALDAIKASIKSSGWSALEIEPPKKEVQPDLRTDIIRQVALKSIAEKWFSTLYTLTDSDPDERSRMKKHWYRLWEDKDLLPLSEWDKDEVRSLLERCEQHFGPYIQDQFVKLIDDARQQLSAFPDSSPVGQVFTSQLSTITSVQERFDVSQRLSALMLLRDWFSPGSIKSWQTSDNTKRAKELSDAFYHKVGGTGLAVPLGLEARRFEDEDRAYRTMMRGIK